MLVNRSPPPTVFARGQQKHNRQQDRKITQNNTAAGAAASPSSHLKWEFSVFERREHVCGAIKHQSQSACGSYRLRETIIFSFHLWLLSFLFLYCRILLISLIFPTDMYGHRLNLFFRGTLTICWSSIHYFVWQKGDRHQGELSQNEEVLDLWHMDLLLFCSKIDILKTKERIFKLYPGKYRDKFFLFGIFQETNFHDTPMLHDRSGALRFSSQPAGRSALPPFPWHFPMLPGISTPTSKISSETSTKQTSSVPRKE